MLPGGLPTIAQVDLQILSSDVIIVTQEALRADVIEDANASGWLKDIDAINAGRDRSI